MAVYQMHFAVTAEHRCTDTSADAFHYLVVLMCCSRPDPSAGYKTGAEYDNRHSPVKNGAGLMKQSGSVQMKRNDAPAAMENRLGTNAHLPVYLSSI